MVEQRVVCSLLAVHHSSQDHNIQSIQCCEVCRDDYEQCSTETVFQLTVSIPANLNKSYLRACGPYASIPCLFMWLFQMTLKQCYYSGLHPTSPGCMYQAHLPLSVKKILDLEFSFKPSPFHLKPVLSSIPCHFIFSLRKLDFSDIVLYTKCSTFLNLNIVQLKYCK